MTEFICVENCFHDGKYWYKGDKKFGRGLTLSHFEMIPGTQDKFETPSEKKKKAKIRKS